MAKKTAATKKRVVKIDGTGQAHVYSSFNNIIVTITNAEGQVISWSSAGKMGFRGSKKNTPYAAQMAAQDCAKVAYDLGLRKVKAYVKGPGNAFEARSAVICFADDACNDLCSAGNAACNSSQNDNNVEDFKEYFHPGLGVNGLEYVFIVGEALALCIAHIDVHNVCQNAHSQNGE